LSFESKRCRTIRRARPQAGGSTARDAINPCSGSRSPGPTSPGSSASRSGRRRRCSGSRRRSSRPTSQTGAPPDRVSARRRPVPGSSA